MKIAIVGATGLVGQKMRAVIAEHRIAAHTLLLAASEKSVGKNLTLNDETLTVLSLEEVLEQKPDIALFSAGGATSKAWAEKFATNGCFVIDNSSAWRLCDDVPLVVPEINGHTINAKTRIIANPNCSTIQMVMALAPLHNAYGIKRVVVSTYQSVTGSGMKGIQQLQNERLGIEGARAYPHPIDLNLIPQGGDFNADGSTTEEQKLLDESRKILNAPKLRLSATVVRVPVYGGHSEAVNVEFENDFDLKTVRQLLEAMPGVEIIDEPEKSRYPTPLTATDKDQVFVGRIRRDDSQPKTLNLWIVSDNLRKGAASNAVQIANYLIKNNLVKNSKSK
jgi:aspartate-semialdehyde dehydrogenase